MGRHTLCGSGALLDKHVPQHVVAWVKSDERMRTAVVDTGMMHKAAAGVH
jgi:hypothetical protein